MESLMNKHIVTKLIALVFSCYLYSTQAAILTVQLPGGGSTLDTTVGSFFDAGVYINSVQDFAGFDFSLTYDSTKMTALTLTSGVIFGAADTETFASSINPGVVHFAEVISGSSSLTGGLNITAPALLGTIHFQALNTVANSPVDILVNANPPILSDFSGNSIAGSEQGALVTINKAVVPLPASGLLFAPGILALFGLRKNKAQSLAI
jgi:Cohesin domain